MALSHIVGTKPNASHLEDDLSSLSAFCFQKDGLAQFWDWTFKIQHSHCSVEEDILIGMNGEGKE